MITDDQYKANVKKLLREIASRRPGGVGALASAAGVEPRTAAAWLTPRGPIPDVERLLAIADACDLPELACLVLPPRWTVLAVGRSPADEVAGLRSRIALLEDVCARLLHTCGDVQAQLEAANVHWTSEVQRNRVELEDLRARLGQGPEPETHDVPPDTS